MEMQPIERQGNSNHAAPTAEDFRVTVGSTPPQSGGAPEISEEVENGHHYRPLLKDAFEGDWESAKKKIEHDGNLKAAIITSRSETVLHMAALNAQDQFVENLIGLLSQEELEQVDCDGRTALHNAVLCGRIRMVKALVNKNHRLMQIPDKEGRVPFHISTREASMHKEIAWFLANNTTDDEPGHPFSSPHAIDSIIGLAYAGHHDIVLHLVKQYPDFLLTKGRRDTDNTILGVLARMPSHFLSGTRLSAWEALIYKCIPVDLTYTLADENLRKTQMSMYPVLQYLAMLLWNATTIIVPTIKKIHDMKLRHVAAVELAKQVCNAISSKRTTEIIQFFEDRKLLGQAAIKGINELVKLCIHFFPELIWISPYGTTLMTLAVEHRHERTLGLFLKVSSTNKLSLVPAPTPDESRRLMKAAADYNPGSSIVTNVSGAAFQYQREIQWFKAVESWVKPDLRTAIYNKKTYWKTFVDEHEKLLETAKKWVEDTANSCMLVSTLIATVLFAAAFTVPGSYNGSTGVPLLLGKDSLLVFAISDALGLSSSVIAILLFLDILTSRYEPQDFLHSLPKKIIMGLLFLFLSLAFMMVAFAATLITMLDKRLEWIFIPISLVTSLPMAFFMVLQLPLLFQMVKSTYGPSIFHSKGTWN